MEEVFIGQQPIFDLNGELISFELLYRNSETNTFPDVDPKIATIEVLVNTYLSPGFEQIAAKKTFINFSADLLATDVFNTLDPNRVVIEVLEDVEITPVLVSRLNELKEMGFQIALDDFILPKYPSTYSNLFPNIDYIKVDFLSTSSLQRAKIEALKTKYPHIILLAEKVETDEQFEEAKSLGYELFQGYFFSKPKIVKSAKLPSDIFLYFDIMNLLNKEDPNIQDISSLIMQDVSLTYRLLKHLNTYAFTSSQKISSVQQAIVRMGLKEFKKWIQFLTIYQGSSKGPAGRTKALVKFSLTRAVLCEKIAARSGKKNTEDYYMLGMFSLMDLILNQDPEEIFPLLPVPQVIRQTLEGKHTEMTPYLKIVEAIERMDYNDALQQAQQLDINKKELSELALKALLS